MSLVDRAADLYSGKPDPASAYSQQKQRENCIALLFGYPYAISHRRYQLNISCGGYLSKFSS